jgi:hypothetical protein
MWDVRDTSVQLLGAVGEDAKVGCITEIKENCMSTVLFV